MYLPIVLAHLGLIGEFGDLVASQFSCTGDGRQQRGVLVT